MNISTDEICQRISKAVGKDAARAAIDRELEAMGRRDRPMNLEQALELLENIASQDGLIGVSARFARSRWILEAANSNLQGAANSPRLRRAS